MASYLSTESIDIYLALRLVSTDLYISICLYAFINYFLVLSISLPDLGDDFKDIDRPGFIFCLFIFFVSYSFWAFNFSISSRFTWVSFFILRSLLYFIITFIFHLLLHCNHHLPMFAQVLRVAGVVDFSFASLSGCLLPWKLSQLKFQ